MQLQVLCEHASTVRMVRESYRARRITAAQSAEYESLLVALGAESK
jgi:hypothetical protein